MWDVDFQESLNKSGKLDILERKNNKIKASKFYKSIIFKTRVTKIVSTRKKRNLKCQKNIVFPNIEELAPFFHL